MDEETEKDLIFLYPYFAYNRRKMEEIKIGWNFFIDSEYDTNSLGRWSGYNMYIYFLRDVIIEKQKQLEKLNEII